MNTEMAETLVRTGPGTRMGNLMRRYWVPILLSQRDRRAGRPAGARANPRREAAGFPRHARARPGLIDEFCSHRGASLYFGRNEEGGIRCAYHGLKFDARRRMRRRAVGAAGVQNNGDQGLSLHRARRHCLGLYGAERQAAGATRSRVVHPAGEPRIRFEAAARMQLSAGNGGRHRHQPRLVRAPLRGRRRSDASGHQGQRLHQGRRQRHFRDREARPSA